MSLQSRVYGFIPTSITGCALWLDGADPAGNGVIPANGDTVSTWVDKSGNANNGTSGTATFNRDSAGGYINFTGGQTYSITNPNVVVNQYFTIFVVEQLQNYAGGEAAFMGGSGSNNANLHIRYYGGNAIRFSFFANDLDTAVTAFFTNATQPNRIWSFSFIANSRVIYLNGTSIGSDANNTQLSGWTGATIGAMVPYGGQYYNGKMREVMIYSGTMATTQRQQVESFLAQKWGLTASLPVGHPGLGETIYRADFTKQNVMRALPYFTQFSPRQISGCALWLDAADSSTITLSGSNVTNVADKSGNGVVLSNATGFTYPNRSFNGTYPSFLCLNGGGGQANAAATLGYNSAFAQTTPFTVFFVSHQTQAGYGYIMDSQSGSSRQYTYNNTLSTPFGNSGTDVTSTPSVVSMTWISGTSVLYLNGTSSYSGALGSFTTGGIIVGNRFSINESWPGHICELIYYNGQLGTSQRQQVESYLAQKWGLTASLPGGHSHATQPAGAVTTTTLTNFRILSRLRTAQFLPTSIAGLQMWMDAADSSSDSMTLSGSTVTVWKDKSGLGNNTTARWGTATLTSSAINGKSAISMAGGYFTGPFATANTGTQVHAFAVMTIDSSSGIWPRPLSLGRPGVNDYNSSTTTFAIIRYNGSQAVGIGRAVSYLSASFPAYSSAFLVQSSHNGSTEYMSVNGNLTVSSGSTGQSGNFNITSYGLGVNTNTDDYFAWNGYYGEVMYFNVQLSDANRQKIEGYLAWKWGLQASLPGGHPYASAAP